eukprot:TRINITY_DN11684_c0_g1_i1.p1 TRINITY_DN11684_c0_g1~~TRINITY_DN11684_c0_g1_i1.p1  ORF type:complete len:740 (-),score=170.62 TRINITY_DN11684_c0_g1_i1:363-2582(-)
MASFSSYEPSEAMMEALRAKVGQKLKTDAGEAGASSSAASRIPEGISASATTGIVRIAIPGAKPSAAPAAATSVPGMLTESRALPEPTYTPMFRPSDNAAPSYAARLAGAEPSVPGYYGDFGAPGPSIFSLKGGPTGDAQSPRGRHSGAGATISEAVQSPSRLKPSPRTVGRSKGKELQPRARVQNMPPQLPQSSGYGPSSGSSSKPPVAPTQPRSSRAAVGTATTPHLASPSPRGAAAAGTPAALLSGKAGGGSALEELARFSAELGLNAEAAGPEADGDAVQSVADGEYYAAADAGDFPGPYGQDDAEGVTLAALSRAAGAGVAGVPKIPSAACLGGVPVAADGGLIYLGGGLYASAQPQREASVPSQGKKQRPLPGRVKAAKHGAQRRLGGSSAIRSASAHLVGHQSGAGDVSPTPSRSHSEGQLNTERPLPPGPHSKAKPNGDNNAWRPSGVSRRPPMPDAKKEEKERHRSMASMGDQYSSGPPGCSTEARAEARREAHRQAANAGLFGAQGLLAQLREGEALEAREVQRAQDASMMPFSAAVAKAVGGINGAGGGPGGGSSGLSTIGPPCNSHRREAERRAAKEAKVQMMLEERALRLGAVQVEQEEKRVQARQRAMTSAASAPDLPQSRFMGMAIGCSSEKDLESQKRRIATKMQFLDIFNGYGKDDRKQTIGQAKALLAQLQEGGGLDSAEAGEFVGGDYDQDDGHCAPDSVEARLREMNEHCNMAFEQSAY